MKYGVWFPPGKRWTNGSKYPKDGFHTFQEAEDYRTMKAGGNFEIREVLPDGTPGQTFTSAPVQQPTAVVYGAHCKTCREYNEYVPKSDTYVCYGCTH